MGCQISRGRLVQGALGRWPSRYARWSRSTSTGARSQLQRGRCSTTQPRQATWRFPSSVTSRSSVSRSAHAGCAWSRSKESRSSRPPVLPRSATAWWSTPRPIRSSRPRTPWSSSFWSITPSTVRFATRAASALCRTSRWAGVRERAGSPTSNATSRSRSSSHRWLPSTASAASSATAAFDSARRLPKTNSCSCWSAATGPSSAPSTTARMTIPTTAT